MRIRKSDKWKTAFQIRYSYFEYQVILFGLFNAPANFQGYVNKILIEKLDVFIIVYLDNTLINTENAGQGHIKALQLVFGELWKHSLFANLKKCHFYKEKVCFLGYIISSQGIRMEEKRIDAIKV